MEGGVLTRISRFSNPANHRAPIHLGINHPHLQVIQSLITQHLYAPALTHFSVRSCFDIVGLKLLSIRCEVYKLCYLPLVSSSVCCHRPPLPSTLCYPPVPDLGFRWLPLSTISWTRETNHLSHFRNKMWSDLNITYNCRQTLSNLITQIIYIFIYFCYFVKVQGGECK